MHISGGAQSASSLHLGVQSWEKGYDAELGKGA